MEKFMDIHTHCCGTIPICAHNSCSNFTPCNTWLDNDLTVFFCVYMHGDGVKVHKFPKKE